MWGMGKVIYPVTERRLRFIYRTHTSYSEFLKLRVEKFSFNCTFVGSCPSLALELPFVLVFLWWAFLLELRLEKGRIQENGNHSPRLKLDSSKSVGFLYFRYFQ